MLLTRHIRWTYTESDQSTFKREEYSRRKVQVHKAYKDGFYILDRYQIHSFSCQTNEIGT